MRVVTRSRVLAAGLAGMLATLPLGAAGEKIDYQAINKIKEQGLQPQNSKVMEISSWLTDVYGPRLTGSPTTQKAGDWAVTKMKEWGLQNVGRSTWLRSRRNLFPFQERPPAGRLAPTASCEVRWSSSARRHRKTFRSTPERSRVNGC